MKMFPSKTPALADDDRALADYVESLLTQSAEALTIATSRIDYLERVHAAALHFIVVLQTREDTGKPVFGVNVDLSVASILQHAVIDLGAALTGNGTTPFILKTIGTLH